jgi:WD40 repeat protein
MLLATTGMAPPFLTLLTHDARQCIYERLPRRDLRALACVCRELSAEVSAAVAQMLRGAHVFPAPAVLRPCGTASLSLPLVGADIAFCGDGSLLAAVCNDGTVQMRDSATGRVLWSVKGHDGIVWRCSFTRDDTLLATAGSDKTVKLWHTTHEGGTLARKLSHNSKVLCVACSPATDVLLSGDINGVATVWDTETGAEVHTLPRHPKAVSSVAFDARGALAATSCQDSHIRLFDVRAAYQLITTLRPPAPGRTVSRVQFRPAAAETLPLLASGSGDGGANLWDVSDVHQPRLLHTLSGHMGDVRALSFSPDGALLATSRGDDKVKLWRVADGTLLNTFVALGNPVWWLSFHPHDASVLAACGWDSRLNMWQL